MDPRDRADAVLARAQARDGVVTPDNMTSPMDAANTQQIPRSVVNRIDAEPDPDSTTKLPSSMIEANDVRSGDLGDSHLAESMPTTPLPQPGAEQAPAKEPTQPMRVPHPAAQPPREQVEQPSGAESPAGGAESDGLVPTVRTRSEQSYLSRRLDGL